MRRCNEKKILIFINIFLILLTGCVKYDSTVTLNAGSEKIVVDSTQKIERDFDDYGNYVYYKIKYKNKTLTSKSGIGEINGTKLLRYRFEVDEIYNDNSVGLYSIALIHHSEADFNKTHKGIVAHLAVNKQKNKQELYKYSNEEEVVFRELGISAEEIENLVKARETFREKNKQEREARTQTTFSIDNKSMEQFEEALQ